MTKLLMLMGDEGDEDDSERVGRAAVTTTGERTMQKEDVE